MILPANGSEEPEPAPALAGLFGAPLVLGLGALAALMTLERPEPVMDARAEGFSTQHALGWLPFVAQEPRPVGSEHHERVRRWLLTEIGDTGVTPGLQAFEQYGRQYTNVIAELPGGGDGGTVLLTCHYDSVPETPGAADNGLSVVALLEALRILARDQPLRNDLVFLFSDGEEHGLVGARQFAADHALMAEVDCVLNFDSIGCDGPLVMFQTGPESGGLVELYAENAPHPVTTSLAPAIYERLPNDTDLTVFLERGLPGLDFAVVGGGSAYHRPVDTHENLDRGTLQLVGDTVLAMARAVGDADLAGLARDERTYFDVVGREVVVYGRVPTLALNAAAFVLLALAALVGGRRLRLGIGGVLLRVPAFAAFVGLVSALGFALWLGADRLVVALDRYVARPRSNAESTAWTVVGLATFAAFALTAVLEWLRRRPDGMRHVGGFALGGLLLWALPLAALVSSNAHAGAQLTAAAVIAAAAACLAARKAALPVHFLLMLVVVPLAAPLLVLVCHLKSTSPRESAIVGAAMLPLWLGLVAPYLATLRHGWVIRTLLLLGSLASLGYSAVVRAQGG